MPDRSSFQPIPPGSGPSRESLPERPRLRPIETFAVEQDGETYIVLRDPTGYVAEPAAVSRIAGVLLNYFDGRHTIDEMVRSLGEDLGVRAGADAFERLARQLDDVGFLDSPRFEVLRRTTNDAYRALDRRPPAFAGVSYPSDPEELRSALDAAFSGVATGNAPAPPTAIIAPHIDLRVADRTYAQAYAALSREEVRPDVFVVLGTAHGWLSGPFVASAVPYDTPLGPVPCDREFLDALATRYPGDLFADEVAHRAEHSIEFQAVHLRYLYGESVPPMIPVLCHALEVHVDPGQSPAHDPRVRSFLSGLRETAAAQRKRVCVVAGADLAHVGPRFDDPEPVTEKELAELEAGDRDTLARVEAGDAEGFYRSVTDDGNRRRVCGLSPIYLTLLWSEGRPATLSGYRQWVEDGSVVSFAAAHIAAGGGRGPLSGDAR